MFAHLMFFRQRALVTAALAAVIVFIVWNVPALNIVLYPFRLFVTFVHETGHGAAALISGGHFQQFVVDQNGGGYALTAGGSRALILPAGYLGAALFGALLFYLTNTLPYPRSIALALAILLALVTVFYTQLLSLAFFVGLIMAGVLVLLWRYADRGAAMLALNLLAILTGLNAVNDLIALTGSADISAGALRNDAAAFSAEVAPLVPAAVWALLWAGLAILIVGAAIYFSLIRHRRR
ncbi:MAG: M50 family metallopeptidase [Anaerolineae bacterium]|nr:M50 family metallopeptidase [Anaerolineae bacterium]NUQ04143.1 M50 family metallopeptidase [Anaerolineae bacterium]